MKNITTVSIGIPAYNEAKNIAKLLTALRAQNEEDIKITEIIIMSDGSSDNTAQIVKTFHDPRIKFIDDHKRLGKSARLDHIFRQFFAQVLILIDADVTIRDQNLISKTIKRADLAKSGIAGVNALPLEAETNVERALEAGVFVMKDIASHIRHGNNYLSFKGCYLALDGPLAKKIHLPASIINNDAYLYFSAIKNGYQPVYLSSCKAYYRSPMTIADHSKQASRFATSRQEMTAHFDLDMAQEYRIPKQIIALAMIRSIMKRPIQTLSYLMVNFKAKHIKQAPIKSTWSIAKSTK